jgi:hypothetical protein
VGKRAKDLCTIEKRNGVIYMQAVILLSITRTTRIQSHTILKIAMSAIQSLLKREAANAGMMQIAIKTLSFRTVAATAMEP